MDKTNLLWPEMADESIIFQLDVLFSLLALLTWYHAISKRGFWQGSALIAFLVVNTILFEHTSLFLGGTHCHATSPIAQITPCSSLNSILFYVPWIYTSVEAALRLSLRHTVCFPLVVGLLQFGFGTGYEMQGPLQNFWKYPDEHGVIAASVAALNDWEGYPPFLPHARSNHEIATIDAEGVFRVSRHAHQALEERLYEFPVLAPYFHFCYGLAWALSLVLVARTISTGFSVRHYVLSSLPSMVLFIIPIEMTRTMAHTMEWSYSMGVVTSLGCCLFLTMAMELVVVPPKKAMASAADPDVTLLGISVLMHIFLYPFPFVEPR